MKLNQKGGIADLILVVSLIFAISISLILAYVTLSKTNQVMQNVTSDIGSTQGSDIFSKYYNAGQSAVVLLAGSVLFVFAFAVVVTAITDWQIQAHPAFMLVSILLAGIAVFLALVYSNAFSIVTSSAGGVVQDIADIPLVHSFFEYLPFIVLGAVVVVLIALYSSSFES